MTNKQLAVLVLAMFVAVLLAYQLFVGFDVRTADQKESDALEARLDQQQIELNEQYKELDSALSNAGL